MTVATVKAVLDRIPSINCTGKCWQSCGPILVSRDEDDMIRQHCRANGIKYHPLPQTPAAMIKQMMAGCIRCKFLTEDHKCSIYPARPAICRMFGVTDEMPCEFGCDPPRKMLSRHDTTMIFNDLGHDNLKFEGVRMQ